MPDIETWQFPVLLTFYPSIAQPVLRYRVDRQDGAAVNARIRRGGPPGCNQPECGWIDHNVSYDGLLYPIMTALTGLDNDGEPEPHWPSEDHMTGDISLAVQQFWQATHNVTWLKELLEKRFEINTECASPAAAGVGGRNVVQVVIELWSNWWSSVVENWSSCGRVSGRAVVEM